MRSQRDEKTSNKESTCFICGINRDQFDQDGQTDFKRHCAYEHNKWHYLFYLIHCQLLDEETPDDINAYERFVLNNFEEGDISWMPLGKAMTMGHSGGGGGGGWRKVKRRGEEKKKRREEKRRRREMKRREEDVSTQEQRQKDRKTDRRCENDTQHNSQKIKIIKIIKDQSLTKKTYL